MTDTAARRDGRAADQLRPLKIELGVNVHAEGSCLIEMGRTRVWITASVEDRVPMHRRRSGRGWVDAEGTPVLDIDYTEDFQASTDLNCVMTEDGRLVELQATAEGAPYARTELDSMLALAFKGIKELIVAQKRALATL